jgi:hypothetical protein
VAHLAFLRSYPREAILELDRRLAAALALVTMALISMMFAGFWMVHRLAGA